MNDRLRRALDELRGAIHSFPEGAAELAVGRRELAELFLLLRQRSAATASPESAGAVLAPGPGGPLVYRLRPAEEAILPNEPAPPPQPMRATISLRNARAGEPYRKRVEQEGLRELALEDSGGSGITLDADGVTLAGTPLVAGDFELRLRAIGDAGPVELVARLAVIPDPKSLWTSRPSDQAARYWKPDEAFSIVEGELRCLAASKRGRSHARDGGFRDDDQIVMVTQGGWHIAAVADGAGSARFSRRGSQLAVGTVGAVLPGLLDEQFGDIDALVRDFDSSAAAIGTMLYQSLAQAAFRAARAIEEEAAGCGEPASSFATTLILAAAKRAGERWLVAGFGIGDGGAALLDHEDGRVEPLTSADSGAYAGQTRFLHTGEFADAASVARRLRSTVIDRFTAIVLMTDGVTDPKFPTDDAFADPGRWTRFWTEDLAPAVDPHGPAEAIERQLSDWLDFWSPGNHDDRTIAILVPQAASR